MTLQVCVSKFFFFFFQGSSIRHCTSWACKYIRDYIEWSTFWPKKSTEFYPFSTLQVPSGRQFALPSWRRGCLRGLCKMHRWQASAHGASSMANIFQFMVTGCHWVLRWLPENVYNIQASLIYFVCFFFRILYMSTIKMIYIYICMYVIIIYIHEQKNNLQIQTSNIFLAPFSRGAFNNRSRHVSVVVCWWRPLTSKSWATTVTHLHLGNGGKVVVILIPSECPFFLCRSDVFEVKYGQTTFVLTKNYVW